MTILISTLTTSDGATSPLGGVDDASRPIELRLRAGAALAGAQCLRAVYYLLSPILPHDRCHGQAETTRSTPTADLWRRE